MRTLLRRASLVVVAAVAARCAFPDMSMVGPSAASGSSGSPDESGDPTGDAFPFIDGGFRASDAQSVDASSGSSDAPSSPAVEAGSPVDTSDASGPLAEAGRPPRDAESPADAIAPAADARPAALDAAAPSVDAAGPGPSEDAANPPGHDAGHAKQYPANIDCTSVAIADCNSTIGFADNPDCGVSGTLVQCGTTTAHDNGNGSGNGGEASKPKESCAVLLQVTAVQTCL